MSEDAKIREQLRRQYKQEELKIQDGMEEEERELREYFNDIQKPISQDPTLVRRQRYNEKMASYQEVIRDISIKQMIESIWGFEGQTPEEIETLYDCKQFFKWRCLEGLGGCLMMTSGISFWNRRYLSYPVIGFGICVGIMTGFATGFLRSTEYTLIRLEQLGNDYQLGRMAINEIEDFRMDKVIKKNI